MELGGFNRLFYPAYCEDLDLCFRAWRRGFREADLILGAPATLRLLEGVPFEYFVADTELLTMQQI